MNKLIYSIFTIFCLFPFWERANAAQYLSLAPHDIFMYGQIDDDLAMRVTQAMREADDGREITLHIISPGGSVYSGLFIIDTMRGLKSPVRTVCASYCMSMAALILSQGSIREALPNATILTHTLSTQCAGKLAEVINCVREGIRLQGIMDSMFMKATSRPLDEVQEMEAFDHYMGAQEAKEWRLIDVITPALQSPQQ